MIRWPRYASTATAAVLVLVLGACSREGSSPGQTSSAIPDPAATKTASVTSSPFAASPTVRRAPSALRIVRPSDLVVRVDWLGELCCPAPVMVATADGRLVTRSAAGTLVERRLTIGDR